MNRFVLALWASVAASTAPLHAQAPAAGAGAGAGADRFPAKPVTVVVQFPAGSAMDIVARLVGDAMEKKSGQPVIVINKPGGAGLVAAASLATVPADGHTLLFPGTAIPSTEVTDPKAAAALWSHLVPVVEITRSSLLCATTPRTGAKTMQQFVAYARMASPEPSYGTSSIGGTHHFLIEHLKATTGMRATHAPFLGAPAVISAALKDEIALLCEPPFLMKPYVEQHKLVPLALSSSNRDVNFPNTPSMKDAGFTDVEFGPWHGFFAPTKTSPAMIGRINAYIIDLLKDPELVRKLVALGYTPTGSGPEAFMASIRAETQRLKKIAVRQNLKFD